MTCNDCIHCEACNRLTTGYNIMQVRTCVCKCFSDKAEWIHLPVNVGEQVFVIYVEENRSISCKGDYDGIAFKTLKHPDGTVEAINRFFIEDAEGNWNEFDKNFYKNFFKGETK